MPTRRPAARPCGTCPYREGAPSGLWNASEYAKLPEYDKPTSEQPIGLFGCHQQDRRLCAGWVGCHDMDNSLSLRLAAALHWMAPEEVEATRAYVSPVPLFASGREAADHGMKDIDNPGVQARRTAARLINKLTNKGVTWG